MFFLCPHEFPLGSPVPPPPKRMLVGELVTKLPLGVNAYECMVSCNDIASHPKCIPTSHPVLS